MSMISEQVKELRELEEDCKCENEEDEIVRQLQYAVNTREALSAKPQAANMEQDLKECIAEVKNSDIPNPSKKKIMNVLYERMHKGGWIPFDEGLLEKEGRCIDTEADLVSCYNISGQMTIEEYLQTVSE